MAKKKFGIKVHIFWEGHKILRNLPLTFDCSTYSQKLGEDFAKFCGLLRIYELYNETDFLLLTCVDKSKLGKPSCSNRHLVDTKRIECQKF